MEKDRHEIETFKIDQMFIGDSQEELIKQGEGRRKEHPIAAISTFNPVKRDVFQLIKLTEEKMIPELLGMRHKRMMQNPFSYFRATAGIMEKDLRQFPDGQSHIPVIICGPNYMPISVAAPLNAHYKALAVAKEQLAASPVLRKQMWKSIVECKIRNQAAVLQNRRPEALEAGDGDFGRGGGRVPAQVQRLDRAETGEVPQIDPAPALRGMQLEGVVAGAAADDQPGLAGVELALPEDETVRAVAAVGLIAVQRGVGVSGEQVEDVVAAVGPAAAAQHVAPAAGDQGVVALPAVEAVVAQVAPELGEWADDFAMLQLKVEAVRAGAVGLVTAREADDLVRDAQAFAVAAHA